jgi:hypothetical protein
VWLVTISTNLALTRLLSTLSMLARWRLAEFILVFVDVQQHHQGEV